MSAIEITVFDFVDELAHGVRNNEISRDDLVEQDSTALTFCETFFDQFFATISVSISGFGRANKERAGERAEELRTQSADTAHIRAVIALYEAFCDMYADLQSDYGGEVVSMTYRDFHTDYLLELLRTGRDWARGEGHADVESRIARAELDYNSAIEESSWMTKKISKESVWSRLTSTKRTSSSAES